MGPPNGRDERQYGYEKSQKKNVTKRVAQMNVPGHHWNGNLKRHVGLWDGKHPCVFWFTYLDTSSVSQPVHTSTYAEKKKNEE